MVGGNGASILCANGHDISCPYGTGIDDHGVGAHLCMRPPGGAVSKGALTLGPSPGGRGRESFSLWEKVAEGRMRTVSKRPIMTDSPRIKCKAGTPCLLRLYARIFTRPDFSAFLLCRMPSPLRCRPIRFYRLLQIATGTETLQRQSPPRRGTANIGHQRLRNNFLLGMQPLMLILPELSYKPARPWQGDFAR